MVRILTRAEADIVCLVNRNIARRAGGEYANHVLVKAGGYVRPKPASKIHRHDDIDLKQLSFHRL